MARFKIGQLVEIVSKDVDDKDLIGIRGRITKIEKKEDKLWAIWDDNGYESWWNFSDAEKDLRLINEDWDE